MKKLILMCGPFSSRSGYGNHARDIYRCLWKLDEYEIKCLDVRWGDCPRNSLDAPGEFNDSLKSTFVEQGPQGIQLDRQPDIYMDIRIPNEFQQIGKVNIGITAGVETSAVSAAWLDGCNKMDLVITVSEHSKMGFVGAKYDKVQNLPDGKQQKVGELKLEKPIEVLFEGLEIDTFKPLKSSELKTPISKTLDSIEESFCYLMVGQWCQGGFGEDRKDIPRAIKTFYETFANKTSPPALVVKTSGATFSILDREDCKRKLNDIKKQFPADVKLPNVYFIHGSLSTEEMNEMYNHHKIKSFYLTTHGEGFGRPLLEASFTGLPIITSNWSGHLDFLNDEQSLLVSGKLEKVPRSVVWKDIIVEDSQWFVANSSSVSSALSFVYTNYNEVKKRALKLMETNREKFNTDKMIEKFKSILDKVSTDIPTQVSLNLPKLKKVGTPKTSQAKPTLPKLKKVTGASV